MSLVRILSEMIVPSDVLQAAAYYIAFETGSAGAFISLSTLEYMDVVVGSFREKRTGKVSGGISVKDIKDAQNEKKGHGLFINNNVYIYRSLYGWFTGLDDPSDPVADFRKKIESAVSVAYPVYNILTERIEKTNPDRDPLTGCMTRKRFYEDIRGVLKAMIVKKIPLWIFYMDFNNFKIVNDLLGHLIGDEVLRSTAMEIRAIFLGYGGVYRVGGDEFIGTAFGIGSKDADNIVKRIEKITTQAPGGIPVNVAVGAEMFENNITSDTSDESLKRIIDKHISVAEGKMFINKEKTKAVNFSSNITEMRKFFKEVVSAAKS